MACPLYEGTATTTTTKSIVCVCVLPQFEDCTYLAPKMAASVSISSCPTPLKMTIIPYITISFLRFSKVYARVCVFLLFLSFSCACKAHKLLAIYSVVFVDDENHLHGKCWQRKKWPKPKILHLKMQLRHIHYTIDFGIIANYCNKNYNNSYCKKRTLHNFFN